MNYADILKARDQAEREIELADNAVHDAARLIAGRLKSSNVSKRVLCELKRELSGFNMKTWSWK